MVPVREPEYLAHVPDHGAGDHRADTEDAGQAGARGADCGGQLRVGLAQLGVQAAEVGQELGGQLAACLGSWARGGDLLEDPGGLPGADLPADAAGHQPAAPRAAGSRPGYGPGPGHGAVWTRSSAPPRGPRRPPDARPSTAAPRPPPSGRHPGRSCWCSRTAAAAPGRPASAAHRHPLTGGDQLPVRQIPQPGRALDRPGPLRPLPCPRQQLAGLGRAAAHPQLAQRLLTQADRHRGVRALARVDPDHHFCHQRTPAVRTGPGDRGGHAQLQCWRSRPFRATPRHGPAGWHLVIKPGHQRDRQADREPSPPRPFNATARLTTIPARSATPQVSIR